MKKIKLKKDLTTFQGKKYLNKSKEYFEGWYFKQSDSKTSIAIIPGININSKKKKAFIQFITKDKSYFVEYNIQEFSYQSNPFQIQIGKNIFRENEIHLNIEDKNVNIKGDLYYSNSEMIHQSILNPNIMGPFTYIPFLECNHAIISMKNSVTGQIKINQTDYKIQKGIGYIEKDWGCSFPKKYIWCQGNHFLNSNTSFMLAIADVPFQIFTFKGLICNLKTENKEYLFTTYNFAKIKQCKIEKDSINIILKKRNYTLHIESFEKESQKLLAPNKGKMNREIEESITSTLKITLKKKKEILFTDICDMCGLEIVKEKN